MKTTKYFLSLGIIALFRFLYDIFYLYKTCTSLLIYPICLFHCIIWVTATFGWTAVFINHWFYILSLVLLFGMLIGWQLFKGCVLVHLADNLCNNGKSPDYTLVSQVFTYKTSMKLIYTYVFGLLTTVILYKVL